MPEAASYVALNLTTSGAYAALVNKPATQTCGGKLVIPGDPAKSYLYRKIADTIPCFGTRMPRWTNPLFPDNSLKAAELATIAGWISAGAPPDWHTGAVGQRR